MRWIFLVVIFASGCVPYIVEDGPPTSALCVVNQVDIQTGKLTQQFEFNGHDLVTWTAITGRWSFITRRNFYDEHGNVHRATVKEHDTGENRKGIPYDSREEHVFKHDDRGNLLEGRTVKISIEAGQSHSWQRNVVHTYDALNHKLSQDEVYADGQNRSTKSNKYSYDGMNLTSIKMDMGDFQGKHLLSEYTFKHDAKGQVIEVHYASNFESTTKLSWDDRGQLIGYDSATFVWDEKGRLTEMLGSDVTMSYDDLDRVTTIRYVNGGGFDLSYSDECPAALTHQRFGPGILNYLSVEGPRDRYKWVSYC